MTAVDEVVKAFPDVWGHKISEETPGKVTVQKVEMVLKSYKCEDGSNGLRISLKENLAEPFFLAFRDYLKTADSFRSNEEREAGIFSFETLSKLEEKSKATLMTDVGFYVYSDHLIFHAEKDGNPPLDRLEQMVTYYLRKFDIRPRASRRSFEELEGLESQS